MKKRVLVTGASGFIGSRLVTRLLARGDDVTVLLRGEGKSWGDRVTYVRGDVAKTQLPVAGHDAVVHLASVIDINGSLAEPRVRLGQNLSMDLALLECVRASGSKPLLVFASTDRVYGRATKRRVSEETRAFPIEPYTASKMMGETALELYAHLFEIPYIVLRFDSVYGPGQPRSMFISDMIQKMRAADEVVTGPLTTQKNFVYVDDVVDAIVRSVHARRAALNQTYNIGGRRTSLRAVLAELQKIFRSKGRTITVREEKRSLRPSKAEVAPFSLDTGKARGALGWSARTPLYKGLEKTIEYFDI